jgi:hypothetical protein
VDAGGRTPEGSDIMKCFVARRHKETEGDPNYEQTPMADLKERLDVTRAISFACLYC